MRSDFDAVSTQALNPEPAAASQRTDRAADQVISRRTVVPGGMMFHGYELEPLNVPGPTLVFEWEPPTADDLA